MVRRPSVSEKEDHQSGNIDILSMYIATKRFVSAAEELKSSETWPSAAMADVSKGVFLPGPSAG